jgi:TonB family protein
MAIFILKLTVCWAFFALLYHVMLRQETFFRANRAYLLGTAALGILLAAWPAEQLPLPLIEPETTPIALPMITIHLQNVEKATGSLQHFSLIRLVYALGVLLTMSRLLWGLYLISKMAASGRSVRLPDGCRIIYTGKSSTPFSFFNRVFVPETTTEPAHSLMLAHERAHAHGKHSVDVLLAECLCIVFWFHPLAHWYRKTLRTVHEYLADAEASKLSDRKQYGLLLIAQSQSGMPIAFVHHFFQSPLKQRLVMLTKKASAPVRAARFGLVIPLILLFAVLFRQSPVMAQADADAGKTLVQPEFPGGQTALFKFFNDNLTYPPAARSAGAEGTVFVEFTVKEDGSLKQVTALEKSAVHPELAAEAVRIVKDMPKWKPAVQEGKVVKTKMTLPVQFKLAPDNTAELADLEQQPEYPGGQPELYKLLIDNIKYPEAARNEGAEGMVVVKFMVGKDGKLSGFENANNARTDFFEEVVRVMQLSPAWKPGIKDGKPVKVVFTLPFKFKL